MKNLSILFAVLFAGTSPLVATDPSTSATSTEKPAPKQQLGSLAISEIRKGYENGNYNLFLKDLDQSYLEARDKNQLTQLSEMREELSADWREWEDQARQLQEQKGRELIAAVTDETNSIFKEKVLSAATTVTYPEQEEALFYIATLRQMAPNTGSSDEENLLIDLDLEYEYKALHTSMPGNPHLDQKEKQMVLRMDKAKKMTEIAANFKDASLKQIVQLYTQNLDDRLEQNWDAMDLNAFAQGKEKPSNRMEEKVASILNQYQEKFSDLAKQFIAQHEKEMK
jgi:hypothetical protein